MSAVTVMDGHGLVEDRGFFESFALVVGEDGLC